VSHPPSAFSLLPAPFSVLLPADVFPPSGKGGAAWSSLALAQALSGRGHHVAAIVPQRGLRGVCAESVGGVPVTRYGYWAPPVPFVQNAARHELLWGRLARLIERLAAALPAGRLVIHAQHVQTCPPAVIAGRRLGAPVVVTVRDHWPWDYFATGLHGNRLPYERNGWAALATDLPARLGPLRGALALPAIVYMRGHLRRRARYLAQADAVIAVSHYIARRLAGIVSPERLHVVPNMVDLAQIERTVGSSPPQLPDEPFLLFAGKLERNKGAGLLLEIFAAYRKLPGQSPKLPPLLVCGTGPLEGELAQGLATLGVDARFLHWVDHDDVLRLMARCALLLFPSLWGDALSRVLIEASAAGAPILATPTGGTPDIVEDGVSGALAATPARFAARMAQLLASPAERLRLGEGARRRTQQRFAADVVVREVEKLYQSVSRHKL
jgi:glycosyltransferase involved in cell wall biosynthesis